MSEVLNLEEFKSPKTTNTRVSKGVAVVNYGLKYRDGTFTLSSANIAKLGLADHSLALKIHPVTNQVVFLVVGDSEGDILKRTDKTGLKKGKAFKSTVIADALAKQGVLTVTERKEGVESYNQNFDLKEVETTSGVKAYVVVPQGQAGEAAETASEAPQASNEQNEGVVSGGNSTTPEYTPTEPDAGDLIAPAGEVTDEDFDEKF